MFGYIIINKPELKFREFDVYHAYYCGLCEALKKRGGVRGRLTLSYDMTFLAMLLSSLYEPEVKEAEHRCAVHPLSKHKSLSTVYTDYAADINLLLSYYKCRDDWADEKKASRLIFSKLLKKACRPARENYADKVKIIEDLFVQILAREKANDENFDEMASLFGRILGELFAPKEDVFSNQLKTVGFFLGKFIYLMDAYEDMEEDRIKGRYNPLIPIRDREDYDEYMHRVLTMMMAECCRVFEQLPIIEHAEILRNILYAGVWCRYAQLHKQA